jgi:hypothetical protein
MLTGVAVIVVALLVVIQRDDPPAGAATPRSAARNAAQTRVPLTEVRLHRLQSTPPDLEDVDRNPFRFGERAVQPAPAPAISAPPPRVAPREAAPPGPPPVPEIPLRYIGLLDAPAQAGRVAVLSDGKGNVFYGKEGDIIEGRYVMLRVGPISADLSYLDGRGRQTIRLSGQ